VVNFLTIGLKPYNGALELQKELHAKRVAGEIPDTVVLCEHPPVFTIGKRDASADFLSGMMTIAEEGIEVVKVERGGRITYHGPGQLVVYFIFNLNERHLGVKEFVNKVEEACMKGLSKFGVNTVRDSEYPGLWIGDKKLVAVGLQITKNVSMHGVAINIDPNIGHYRHIIPCGIKDRGVTSMKEVLGEAPAMEEVIGAVKEGVTEIFTKGIPIKNK